jgi:hypothetical protein
MQELSTKSLGDYISTISRVLQNPLSGVSWKLFYRFRVDRIGSHIYSIASMTKLIHRHHHHHAASMSAKVCG